MKTFIDFEKFITENPLDRHVIEAANENDPTLNKQLYPPHINIKEREDLERHQRETMVEKFKEPVFVEQVARKYSLKYYEALRDYNTRAL